MKKLFTLFIIVLASKSHAFDDCTRQLPEPLVTNKDLVSGYVITQPRERELQETFKLKSGQDIIIFQTGCAHFVLTYKASFSELPKSQTVNEAISLLKQIQQVAPFATKNIINGLQKVKDKTNPPDVITLTEGYDWVYLKSEQQGKVNTLVITYDIAL